MDFEPDKILEALQKLFEAAGIHPPLWLTRTITWGVLFGVFLCALWGFLYVLSKIKELAAEFVPSRLNRETRRRLARRRRFAEHVENEVRRLNSEQSWSDYRFAELEAEVEAEGRRRALPFLPLLLPRTTSGLRRERSLTKAIDISRERLILIEGDPGSGKSVALRHVTMKLAGRARRRGLRAVIPLYINLKEIDRLQDRSIDRNLIEEFILKTLNRINDRDVEEYLEEEFGAGLEAGTWLFLFDSFDEIPEVLGSTEPDAVIREYTKAIDDFLHGMNRCRGVVASRYFRGPGQVPWPRFRVLPLSSERREELVRKADLPATLERELLGQLPFVAEGMGDQFKNPLFLGLICEHMKSGRPFPGNGHAVFENYIDQRLTRDAERLTRRYGLEIAAVRKVAEEVAFCMAADPSLGLSPQRARIPDSMSRQGFEVRSILETCLDALEFIKLARSESGAAGSGRLFTFAHRRFQEYFATCLVVDSPNRVSPQSLLLDGRWRETAVVICQTGQLGTLDLIFEDSRRFLENLTGQIMDMQSIRGSDEPDLIKEFPWPSGALHVLGLLQDGFAGRADVLPSDIRRKAGELLKCAVSRGNLSDYRWSLEVAGSSDEDSLLLLLRRAFAGNSRWISEVAYRQVGRLTDIPLDIFKSVHEALVSYYLRGIIRRDRHATFAHLSRLEGGGRFLNSFRLLLALPIFDFSFHLLVLVFAGFLYLTSSAYMRDNYLYLSTLALVFSFLSLRSFENIERLMNGTERTLDRKYVDSFSKGALGVLRVKPSSDGTFMASLARVLIVFVIFSRLKIESAALVWLGGSSVLLIWAPIVLRVVERGAAPPPIGWLLAVLVPLRDIVEEFSDMDIRKLFADLFKAVKATLLSIPLVCEFAIVMLVIFFPAVMLAAPGSIHTMLIDVVRDYRMWRSIARRETREITISELLEDVVQFASNKFRVMYIKTVREHSLLPASMGAERKIVELALNVERRILPKHQSSERAAANEMDKLGAALRLFTKLGRELMKGEFEADKDQKYATWSVEALEELWLLREALRAEPPTAGLSPERIEGMA